MSLADRTCPYSELRPQTSASHNVPIVEVTCMNDQYHHFRVKLQDAGFYAPSSEDMGTWTRIIPCSEGPPEASRYGGRSFWIACVDNSWYIGTWGSHTYELADPGCLLDFTTAFLTAREHVSDISADLIREFGLSPVSDDVISRLLVDGRQEK